MERRGGGSSRSSGEDERKLDAVVTRSANYGRTIDSPYRTGTSRDIPSGRSLKIVSTLDVATCRRGISRTGPSFAYVSLLASVDLRAAPSNEPLPYACACPFLSAIRARICF